MMSFWRRKYDRIQIGRKQYRIEFNVNSLFNFMEFHDMKFWDMKDLDNVNPAQIVTYFYEAIKEGCRLENKKFPYSREDFAAMLSPESIAEIGLIMQSRNAGTMKNLQKDD